MKNERVSLAIIVTVIIGVWVGGCQEQQQASSGELANLPQDADTFRIIAAENRQLKAEIETLKTQIELDKKFIEQGNQQIAQKTQETREQKKLIEEQKLTIESKNIQAEEYKKRATQAEQGMQNAVELATGELKAKYEDILSALIEKQSELIAENEWLKAELGKVKGGKSGKPDAGEEKSKTGQ